MLIDIVSMLESNHNSIIAPTARDVRSFVLGARYVFVCRVALGRSFDTTRVILIVDCFFLAIMRVDCFAYRNVTVGDIVLYYGVPILLHHPANARVNDPARRIRQRSRSNEHFALSPSFSCTTNAQQTERFSSPNIISDRNSSSARAIGVGGGTNSAFGADEYAVYDVARVRLEYLVELRPRPSSSAAASMPNEDDAVVGDGDDFVEASSSSSSKLDLQKALVNVGSDGKLQVSLCARLQFRRNVIV